MTNYDQWKTILEYLCEIYYIEEGRVNVLCDHKVILSFDENDSPLDFGYYIYKESLIIPNLSLKDLENFPFEIFIKDGYDAVALQMIKGILYAAYKLKDGRLTTPSLAYKPYPIYTAKTETSGTYSWRNETDIH